MKLKKYKIEFDDGCGAVIEAPTKMLAIQGLRARNDWRNIKRAYALKRNTARQSMKA